MYLDYVGLRVSRLAPAVRFFTKGLGLVEVRRGTMDHGGVWVLLHDRTSHQHLELNWYPRGSKYYTEYVAGEGFDHIGVRVNHMRAAGRKVRAAGGTLVRQVEEGGEVVVEYYEGPDGLWVELILSPSE